MQRPTRLPTLPRRRRPLHADRARSPGDRRQGDRRGLLEIDRRHTIMLDATLWIAQGFLALFFLAAGLPKIVGRGIDRWIGFDDLPRPLTIVIGLSEVAAAVALVV